MQVFYPSPSPLILGYEEVQSHSNKDISSPTAPGKESKQVYTPRRRKTRNEQTEEGSKIQ
jgi:hypothetical protein